MPHCRLALAYLRYLQPSACCGMMQKAVTLIAQTFHLILVPFNYGHLPYEKQQELLRELGGIDVGVGTGQATNARVYEAIVPSVSQLREWVQQQSHVHVDETPWPVLGVKEWLWVTADDEFCLFHAGDTRSRAELDQQLGTAFNGVISTDDYSVYNGYPVRSYALEKKAWVR